MSSYIKITHEEFRKKMDEMGFHMLPGLTSPQYKWDQYTRRKSQWSAPLKEYVYFRNIVRDTPEETMAILGGKTPKYSIRIYSSIDIRTNESRDSGKDAIRVILYDNDREQGVGVSKRINRTENALGRMLKAGREVWKIGANPATKCPQCGFQLVERTNKFNGNKFMGCSGYPQCHHAKAL